MSDAKTQATIAEQLKRSGVSRRDFLCLCSTLMVAAPMGLALTSKMSVAEVARAVGKSKRPSVIWLHLQECTGCSETLLRTSMPDVAHLILDVISLDYHETLMAAAGHQAEAVLRQAVSNNAGKFVLVVEGGVPTAMDGKYLLIAGKPGLTLLKEVASQAAMVVSMGSCSSWGGVASADPNPTNAVGVDSIITDKPVINLPGCPPSPYTLLAVVLEHAVIGKLPALDAQKRPKFAYGRLIHDHCPRRAHFDAGRFAQRPGDRDGLCLYKLGCKGPATHAACPTRRFNDLPDAWPIGVGAPCMGCTEKGVGFTIPNFQTIAVQGVTPPEAVPGIHIASSSAVGEAAAGLVGAIAGGVAGASWMAARRLPPGSQTEGESKESKSDGDSGGK
jgi:hydrogenase small subunit